MVVSKEIKNYLKTWISSEEVKTIFNSLLAPILTQDSMEELLKKYVQEGLLSRISELETQVASQQEKIDLLESAAAIRDNTLSNLEQKCDDNEQYSRRASVRLYGTEVNPGNEKENVSDKVLAACESMEVNLDMSNVDRIHRIGKKSEIDKKTVQAVIIKFRYWTSRTEFYKSRPKNYNQDGTRKPGAMYSISPDLTRRRYELLKHARNAIVNYPNVSYAFADINCSLGIRTNDNKFYYFNNSFQLDKILAKLE